MIENNTFGKKHNSIEFDVFDDKDEFIISLKIRLKIREIQDFFINNYLCLIISFSLIIILILIFFLIFMKTKLFIDLFYGGKIFYKREKNLNLNGIKKQLEIYRNEIKINFDEKTDFIKREKPKISLIITIYNQEDFLKYSYAFIQKQTFKDIEIIFIDDASTDNSLRLIKSLTKKDKRINYLKNKENKGSFQSRNQGVLFSKGNYILIIDPDDLLLNDILIKAYEMIKYYNLDILQYYVLKGSYMNNKIWSKNKYQSGILYDKEVKDVFFKSISRTLWDKLIKREVFISGINFMKKEFRNETYFVHSDDTVFWGIINFAKSYGFLEQIGYFYNYDNLESKIHHYYDSKYINIIFHSLFATLKYYYFQTEENEIEKNLVGYNFFYNKIYLFYKNRTTELTEGIKYIIDVLDIYYNCSFFETTQKIKLKKFKDLIINNNKTFELL